MKKHVRPMVPALGALVLLCAAYGFITWQQGRSAKAKEPGPEDTAVYMTDLPGLSALSWKTDDKSLSFTQENGTWYYKGDDDCPICQYPLTTLADTLSHLKAERKLEGADSPESYGLDHPSVRFDTVSSDGSSRSILLGSQVPGTGSESAGNARTPARYYAAVEGDSRIYIIGSYLADTAGKGLYDFVETETLPHVSGADIREITISRDGLTSRFCKKTADDSGNTAWYRNSCEDEASRLDDNGALNNLADAISGLSFQSCVSYKASDEELGSFGLSAPQMTLSWTYESGDINGTVSLMIGSPDEDGKGYYTRKDDSYAVNLISKDEAERCLNAVYP